MYQLTFFDQWYDNYIGKVMYCNYQTFCYKKISNFEFNLDPLYPDYIYISFEGIKFKQIFTCKQHFLNWFDQLGKSEISK